MELHFTQHFEVEPKVLRDYGAFDIRVVYDLPLFIDPCLLFTSDKADCASPRSTCYAVASLPRPRIKYHADGSPNGGPDSRHVLGLIPPPAEPTASTDDPVKASGRTVLVSLSPT